MMQILAVAGFVGWGFEALVAQIAARPSLQPRRARSLRSFPSVRARIRTSPPEARPGAEVVDAFASRPAAWSRNARPWRT
jgi:hypothetical protein